MSFHFVNQSDITNTKQRKLIRSHVMKGKNLGKKKPNRRQHAESAEKNTIILRGTGNSSEPAHIISPKPSQRENNMPAITRQVAHDFSILASMTGIKIDSETVSHIRHLFFYVLEVTSPPDFCRPTGVTAQMWAHLAIHNKAYFHCTIAMASACAAFMTGDKYRSPVALAHMSEAYRLLNDRLSSNEPLSDTTVAVVASINVYDRLYGDPQKAMIHLNGLANMIALTGGIGELAKRNIIIAEKVFQSDIELALSCGSTPKFSSAGVPRDYILTDPGRYCNDGDVELRHSILYQSVSAELGEIVLEALRLTRILHEASRRADKLDSIAYQCTHVYIGYRLLEMELDHESGEDTSLDVLVHSALTGFLNTFCFGLGGKFLAFPLVMERFRSVARSIRGDSRSQQMVLLWALLIGRTSSLVSDGETWLVERLRTLAHDLELRSWSEVRDALCTFPWVRSWHDAQGERFWRAEIEGVVTI
ncbi:hypothetical protein F5Y08DRAFT_311640 [Xylaria arbuscula]|nr:hypothetical protein F5Y08DRAFT_311640 [Xylaria arbuscula]